MGEDLTKWLRRPIYIYSFGLFFLIDKTASCFQSFQPFVFILFLSIYCAINYLALWLAKRTKRPNYNARWIVLIWIIVLYTPSIISFLFDVTQIPGLARVRYIVLFFVILYLLLGKIKLGDRFQPFFNYFINLFIFILTGLVLVAGLQIHRHEEQHAATLSNRHLPSLEVINNRDIVWILLDEYTAPASLRSQFHFKDPLVDSLKSKSFFVFDSLHSRSESTIYAINSLFNLDDSLAISNFSYAANSLKRSVWVDKLRQKGYNFISLDFLDIANRSGVSFIRPFPKNYVDQVLYGTIINDLWYWYIKPGAKGFDDYNQWIISRFSTTFPAKKHKPVFIWAHLLIPHSPFYRDAAGKINSPVIEDVRKASSNDVSRQYINYLEYGNGVVLKMLGQIPDWKNKIVVISGDHGARMIVPENDPRRKTPFAAIYYPGMDTTKLKKIKYLQQIPFYLH